MKTCGIESALVMIMSYELREQRREWRCILILGRQNWCALLLALAAGFVLVRIPPIRLLYF